MTLSKASEMMKKVTLWFVSLIKGISLPLIIISLEKQKDHSQQNISKVQCFEARFLCKSAHSCRDFVSSANRSAEICSIRPTQQEREPSAKMQQHKQALLTSQQCHISVPSLWPDHLLSVWFMTLHPCSHAPPLPWAQVIISPRGCWEQVSAPSGALFVWRFMFA